MLVLGPYGIVAVWRCCGCVPGLASQGEVPLAKIPCKNPVQKVAVKNPDQKSLSKLVGLLGLLVGNQVPLMSHLARCVLARYILARYISPQLESDYARVCRCLYMRVHFESPVLLNFTMTIRLIMVSV